MSLRGNDPDKAVAISFPKPPLPDREGIAFEMIKCKIIQHEKDNKAHGPDSGHGSGSRRVQGQRHGRGRGLARPHGNLDFLSLPVGSPHADRFLERDRVAAEHSGRHPSHCRGRNAHARGQVQFPGRFFTRLAASRVFRRYYNRSGHRAGARKDR